MTATRPLRFEAAAYDHGFRLSHTVTRFDDLVEAQAYAAAQPRGREVSFTGRAQQDVTWFVRDTQTGVLHPAEPEPPTCTGYGLDEVA